MIKVKICGIKTIEDIGHINTHLPDYAGFVFAESKRKLTTSQAKELIRKLRNNIKKVGVFVNHDLEELTSIVNECQLDVIQLHGDEDNEYIKKIINYCGTNTKIWKSIRIKGIESIKTTKYHNVDALLLDTYNQSSYGGTGETFDWKIALKLKDMSNIILAGGLNPDNVKQAVNFVKPYAVDVSSGVENNYGKDAEKVKKFIYSVKYNLY